MFLCSLFAFIKFPPYISVQDSLSAMSLLILAVIPATYIKLQITCVMFIWKSVLVIISVWSFGKSAFRLDSFLSKNLMIRVIETANGALCCLSTPSRRQDVVEEINCII